jgi:hypothetical protein
MFHFHLWNLHHHRRHRQIEALLAHHHHHYSPEMGWLLVYFHCHLESYKQILRQSLLLIPELKQHFLPQQHHLRHHLKLKLKMLNLIH